MNLKPYTESKGSYIGSPLPIQPPMKLKLKRKPKPSAITFPLIAESLTAKTGLVVLFSSPRTGTVIHSTDSHDFQVGYYSKDWVSCLDLTSWEKFDGEITLGNE